jgi:tetratricopeptide (TPR) repeat protein
MAKLALSLSQALSRAISAYNAGKLVEAEQLCQQLINAKPDLFDALHLLAAVQSRLGKKDMALASFGRALKVRPDSAEAFSNRGLTLHALKRLEEALASYDRALKVRPDFAEAHFNRGGTLRELQRFEEALASYDRALKVRPAYAEALYNRGNTLHELKRFEEALASFDRALKARPDYADALSNRGVTLHELKRFADALASYDRALKARPGHAEAFSNRGLTLHELQRFEEALASYDHALTVRPDYAKAHFNRGVTLHELRRFEEALASYDRALTVRPDYAEALSNRGATLHDLRRFEEALASFDHALTVQPDYAEAHYNEALCRLLIGDFDRGFDKNEWRWESEQRRKEKRNFVQPLWVGSNEIGGKTILLHAEQGFGDTIQFCRYAPLVAERGARVILEVPRPLDQLMGTLAVAAQIVSRGDPLPIFDIHCPLLSLPLAFGTRLETIPSATPYLRASSQSVMNWDTRLGPKPKRHPRIGLAWSGRPTHKNDHNRSIRLGSLLSLLDINATFVSLQKDVRSDDATVLKDRSDLVHFGDALENFSDTAALISNLDLVISVDTSVAHLAGALAKPVWVLLPFVPDWRWLLDRDDSPWYPTARLFRQNDARAWDSVIARVHAALYELVQS